MPMIHCTVEINKPINFTLMFIDRPGRARHIITATTTSSRDFRTGTHSCSNSAEPRAASGTHSPPGHGVFPQTRSRQAWKRHTAMSIGPTSSPGPASGTPNTRGLPESHPELRQPPLPPRAAASAPLQPKAPTRDWDHPPRIGAIPPRLRPGSRHPPRPESPAPAGGPTAGAAPPRPRSRPAAPLLLTRSAPRWRRKRPAPRCLPGNAPPGPERAARAAGVSSTE